MSNFKFEILAGDTVRATLLDCTGDTKLVFPAVYKGKKISTFGLAATIVGEKLVKEIVFEDIRMDLVEKKVFRSNNYVHLGPTEFRLLKLLMQDPGKVFSREILLKTVWGDNIYVESRTVDVHIRRLRRALNEYGADYIRTVRATGYSIDNSSEAPQE